jgi:arylsulfatase A-like enzyme
VRAGPIAPGFRHVDVLDRIVDEAEKAFVSSLEEAPDRPVFLYLSLTAPHMPWVPTEKYRGKSGAGRYGDFVIQIDDVVGRVLGLLDRLHVAENSLVVFTSDNGSHWEPREIEQYDHRANDGYRGQKADIWEGGHRVPFILRWPGRVEEGRVSGALFGLVDLWATLATIAGAELPAGQGEDSHDQSPLFLGEEPEQPIRDELVHHSYEAMFALRQGPWKLIEGLGSGGFTDPAWRLPEDGEPPGRLHHLGRDPGETKNLWNSESERVEQMQRRLNDLRSGRVQRPR